MGKNGDHFLALKSGPPLIVVIKMGPGKWAPFFLRSEPPGAGKWAPFFSRSEPETGVEELLCESFQATAVWRWGSYLQRLDRPEKTRVLVNVDETSVRLVPQEGKGHVSNRAYRLLCSGLPLGRNASLAAQRSAITHVTAICDNPEIQNLLPQVVLVGESQFTEVRFHRLRSEAPDSVHLWRQKRAWMTTDLMVQYILLLGGCLQKFQTTHRFILYLDALRAHVSPRVLRTASRANLWICVIPAKMTWALQPCDTHVFASYKRLLGEEYQRRSGLTAAGDITWELLLGSLWHVVNTLLRGKDWSAAFDAVGLRGQQRRLSDRTRRKLQYPLEAPQVQASLPTLSDFEQIWPKRVWIPIHELFLPVERFLRGLPQEPLPEREAKPSLPPEVKSQVNSWFGRTRSTSSRSASSSTPVVRPEPCPTPTALRTPEPPLPPTTAPSLRTLETDSERSAMPPPPLPRRPVGRLLPWKRHAPST